MVLQMIVFEQRPSKLGRVQRQAGPEGLLMDTPERHLQLPDLNPGGGKKSLAERKFFDRGNGFPNRDNFDERVSRLDHLLRLVTGSATFAKQANPWWKWFARWLWRDR